MQPASPAYAEPEPPIAHLTCAMTLLPLWDAPEVVRTYLAAGTPSLRRAAETAAWAVSNATAIGTSSLNGTNAGKCAAKAAALACRGDHPNGLLRAGCAARAFAGGEPLYRRGDWMAAEKAASEAFRRVWEPILLPIAVCGMAA